MWDDIVNDRVGRDYGPSLHPTQPPTYPPVQNYPTSKLPFYTTSSFASARDDSLGLWPRPGSIPLGCSSYSLCLVISDLWGALLSTSSLICACHFMTSGVEAGHFGLGKYFANWSSRTTHIKTTQALIKPAPALLNHNLNEHLRLPPLPWWIEGHALNPPTEIWTHELHQLDLCLFIYSFGYRSIALVIDYINLYLGSGQWGLNKVKYVWCLKQFLALSKHLINGRIYYVTPASEQPCVWMDREMMSRKAKWVTRGHTAN